jgi:hypothetical protein
MAFEIAAKGAQAALATGAGLSAEAAAEIALGSAVGNILRGTAEEKSAPSGLFSSGANPGGVTGGAIRYRGPRATAGRPQYVTPEGTIISEPTSAEDVPLETVPLLPHAEPRQTRARFPPLRPTLQKGIAAAAAAAGAAILGGGSNTGTTVVPEPSPQPIPPVQNPEQHPTENPDHPAPPFNNPDVPMPPILNAQPDLINRRGKVGNYRLPVWGRHNYVEWTKYTEGNAIASAY